MYTNGYIFRYAAIMVIIAAALLSTAAMLLKPFQERNVAIEKMAVEGDLRRRTLRYQNSIMTVVYDATLSSSINSKLSGNRNGLYKCLILESPGSSLGVTISLGSEVGS